jgi:capsular polysaccharide biosynthesis protein
MEERKEIELIEYLDVIWRKKLFIIIPTILLVLMAGWCSLRAPHVFAVDALIVPGNIMVQTPGGRLEKIQVVNPMQLAIQINQGAYNAKIAEALDLDPREISSITAENLRDPRGPQYLPATDLILVSTYGTDPERAQQILQALFDLVRQDVDAKIKVEAMGVDARIDGLVSKIKEKEVEILENENQIALTALDIKALDQERKIPENDITRKKNDIETKRLEIESIGIEKEGIDAAIVSLQNRITILDDYEESMQAERAEVRARIEELEELQRQTLAARKTETQAISLLLYSTEIQRSLQYSNELTEKIHAARVDREDLALDIQKNRELLKQRDNMIRQVGAQIATIQADMEDNRIQVGLNRNQSEKVRRQITSIRNANQKIRTEISSLESEVKLLESQKARTVYTELEKAPGTSPTQVGRNPLFLVLIAGFVSAMMFTILAFFIDYIQKHRAKSRTT